MKENTENNKYFEERPKLHADQARVFRDMEMLTERLYLLVEKFPSSYKTMLGIQIIQNCVTCLSYIRESYDNTEGVLDLLRNTVIKFGDIIMLLRLSQSFHCISIKQHANLFDDLKKINKQLRGWYKKQQKEMSSRTLC